MVGVRFVGDEVDFLEELLLVVSEFADWQIRQCNAIAREERTSPMIECYSETFTLDRLSIFTKIRKLKALIKVCMHKLGALTASATFRYNLDLPVLLKPFYLTESAAMALQCLERMTPKLMEARYICRTFSNAPPKLQPAKPFAQCT